MTGSLPALATAAELDDFRAAPERWRPAVAELARIHEVDGALTDLGGGNLVVAVGEGHVLKLTPPAFARELRAEGATLAHVAGRLPVSVPTLLAAGEHQGWEYVLMTRVPGIPWTESTPSTLARIGMLRALGAFLAELHAVPLPAAGFLAGWEEFVAAQRPLCSARQQKWGVPPALVRQIPAFLAASRAPASRLALLHADLTGGNVIVDREQLSGVIDFGDARCGDPLYDLVTPALLLGRGDRGLVAALLDGFGLAPAERTPELQDRLMAYAVIHPWNDLTRYLGWAPGARTLSELGRALFPF